MNGQWDICAEKFRHNLELWIVFFFFFYKLKDRNFIDWWKYNKIRTIKKPLIVNEMMVGNKLKRILEV